MISYNIQLSTKNTEDFNSVKSILECNQYVWNKLSETQFAIGDKLDRKILHDKTYYEIRKSRPEIPSQVIIRAENDVRATFKSIKSNKHEITEVPFKNNLSMRLDKRLYRLEKNKIFVTTLGKRVELDFCLYPKVKNLLEKYEFGDPLIFIRDNKILLALLFKTPGNIPPSDSDIGVGIDLGMKNIAATSEGIVYQCKDFLKKKREIRFLKRKLAKKGTKSARKHKKKLAHKELNLSDNFAHHLVNNIIGDTKANVIVLEDLKHIKKKTCKKNNKNFSNKKTEKSHNNRWSQIPVRKIQTIFDYKAALFNKKVCYVPATNTSKIDSRTGKKNGIRNKGRYIGKDGKLLHSDINASINIVNRSQLPISGCTVARQKALFGQAIVNKPIVFKPSVAKRNDDALQVTAL